MKTQKPVKFLAITCFIPLLFISCSKKDMTNPALVQPVTQPSAASIGAILDSGAVNSTTRVMKMALNTENFTLYGSNEEVSYAAAKVNVAFYVNNDGLIPSGDYNFSSSGSKIPFTFDSGVLLYAVGSDSYSTNSDQIVDGTISVKQDGSKYVFSLQISLASGLTASQIYSGALDYEDSK